MPMLIPDTNDNGMSVWLTVVRCPWRIIARQLPPATYQLWSIPPHCCYSEGASPPFPAPAPKGINQPSETLMLRS